MKIVTRNSIFYAVALFPTAAVGFINLLGSLQNHGDHYCFQKASSSSHCFMGQQYESNNKQGSSASSPANLPSQSSSGKRRNLILSAGGGFFGGMFSFGDDENNSNQASAASIPAGGQKKSYGPTNEVVKIVNGIKQRRLGGSDIVVSELGLGTQR